jgi:tripartite-type tricarboxylate transporter receptor subunit TctC
MALKSQLKVLAITGDKRSPALSDAPTFRELGLPQIVGADIGFNVRAGTPQEIIQKIHDAASRALQDTMVVPQLGNQRLAILNTSPEDAAKSLAAQSKTFAAVAQEIGLKPQ